MTICLTESCTVNISLYYMIKVWVNLKKFNYK